MYNESDSFNIHLEEKYFILHHWHYRYIVNDNKPHEVFYFKTVFLFIKILEKFIKIVFIKRL